MKGVESTEPGVPYLSCYPDNYYNVSVFPVFFLVLLSGISVPEMQ